MKLSFSKLHLGLAMSILSLTLFAQDKKVPLKNFNMASSIYDTCLLACNLFPVNRDHLIATDNLDYEALVNGSECYYMPENFEPGCLLTYNNQKWVLVKVLSGNNLTFSISNTNNFDIDAAIWGPIQDADLDYSCSTLTEFPKSCDYTTAPTALTLNNADVDEYYLLLITNFSNDHTIIHLPQPTGGTVRYSYFCPKNINLNDSISGDQNLNAQNTVTLSSDLSYSNSMKTKGGENILLLPGFQATGGTVFEADIRACENTTENYNPPAANIQCENFTNHMRQSPHLYANTYANELVGTVFAIHAPEYKVTDSLGWKPMTKLGKDEEYDRYLWAYREPYNSQYGTPYVSLRTASGCPSYGDVRGTHPESYLGEEDTNLPNLTPIDSSNYANIDSPFYLATYLGDAPHPSSDTYLMYLKPDLPGLGYRINGGPWQYNISSGLLFEDYNDRWINVSKINYFSAPKDFIMDFSQDNGATVDRYIVTRNRAGGHFSVTTTFTRLADHSVTVHTFQGDRAVPMKLGNVNSCPGFNNTFKMGQMAEGNYTFPLKSAKDEFILDDALLLRVRYGNSSL